MRTLIAGLLLAADAGSSRELHLHGDATELRSIVADNARSRSGLVSAGVEGHDLWGFGSSVAVVLRYDVMIPVQERRKSVQPWRPVWENPILYERNGILPAAFRSGRLILIFRAYDAKTCMVNALEGARIQSENSKEQDRTTREIQCSRVRDELAALQVPNQYAEEIAIVLNADAPKGLE